MARLAPTALSIAISTALQISGLGGPIAIMIAWLVSALLAMYLLLTHLKRKSASASTTSDQSATAGHGAWLFGHQIVRFVRARRFAAPRSFATTQQASRRWMPRRNPKQAETERAYDADTVTLFLEQFGDGLVNVVRLLRDEELIGAIEAQSLATPSNPAEIEMVGHRLVELGSQGNSQVGSTVRRVELDAESVKRRRGSRSPAPGRGGSRA